MREIKFRAWEDWTEIENENNMDNRLPKKMHSWEDLRKWNRSSLGNAFLGESNELTLMQFTGLKDKNGKEIYGGDIVEYGKLKVEVYMAQTGEWICNFQGEIHSLFDLCNDCKVIGNKFENPELLK